MFRTFYLQIPFYVTESGLIHSSTGPVEDKGMVQRFHGSDARIRIPVQHLVEQIVKLVHVLFAIGFFLGSQNGFEGRWRKDVGLWMSNGMQSSLTCVVS